MKSEVRAGRESRSTPWLLSVSTGGRVFIIERDFVLPWGRRGRFKDREGEAEEGNFIASKGRLLSLEYCAF